MNVERKANQRHPDREQIGIITADGLTNDYEDRRNHKLHVWGQNADSSMENGTVEKTFVMITKREEQCQMRMREKKKGRKNNNYRLHPKIKLLISRAI